MAISNNLHCPSCSHSLSEVNAASVKLDICNSGCGGIWFDGQELNRFEDPKVFLPPQLFRVLPNSLVAIDRNKPRNCPRCSAQVLQPQLQKNGLGIEVDSCLGCSGVWLDLGEINSIRDDKKKVAEMEVEIKRIQQMASNIANVPKGLLAVLKLIFT